MTMIRTSAVSLMRVTMYDCVHLILSVVFLDLTLISKGTNACTDMVFCSNGLISNNPELCYNENIQLSCCKSCNNTYTGREGCEYGDRVPFCTKLYCDILFSETDCCATCSSGYSEVSATTTEDNLKLWNHQTPQPTVDKRLITGGIVGMIVFLIMIIPIGYLVRRKVFRRQEEAAHPLDNRPAVPVRVKSSRKKKKNDRNQSSVHTYDLPDNGYIDVSPVFQMSCNLPDTANGHNIYMETRSSATAGQPIYIRFSNEDEVSTENAINR